MSDHCLICGADVLDYDPQMCCGGHECGCMGLPTNPCLCSKECADALFNHIGTPFEDRRIAAGIPWRGKLSPLLKPEPKTLTLE